MFLPQTKQDFTLILQRMLSPLKGLFTAHCAGINVGGAGAGYPESVIRMEALSRPLWALAPFWAGGGVDDDLADKYRRGLAAGTDPESPEYWGDPGDYDQRFVEMAAIACAIMEVPEVVWQPLTSKQRENLAAWLGTANAHTLPDCNWKFFRVMVNLALKSVDMPYSPQLLAADIEQADEWYAGDGWYSDGPAEIKPQLCHHRAGRAGQHAGLHLLQSGICAPPQPKLYPVSRRYDKRLATAAGHNRHQRHSPNPQRAHPHPHG